MKRRPQILMTIVLMALTLGLQPVLANTYRDVFLPQGDASFADAVVSYSPAGSPSTNNPANALGVPDYPEPIHEFSPNGYVSLGGGGSITLQFTDNVLTGSGDATPDLWIFEVGPGIEPTYVSISQDGVTWHDVGTAGGRTFGIDIDAYGFGVHDRFAFVTLVDVGSGGGTGTAGADIDAVGAITSDWAMCLTHWEVQGFKNQGQCIRFVETGKDSRD